MAWTKNQMGLACMMLITGSINTLSTKWADSSEAVGVDGSKHKFDHPFLQAVGMFIGELSCLVVFTLMRIIHTRRNTLHKMDVGNQNFNPLIFLPAALLDMCGTSTMYVGLNLTYASSFQMLRGAVMIFTALLSVIFLRRCIQKHMWLGMFTIIVGLVAVGVSDIVFGNDESMSDKNGIITGDLLIIIAQIVTASQMVYEEKFVIKHNVPALQAVGWEGFFGTIVLGLLLIPMYYIKAGRPLSMSPDGRMENVLDAFTQMNNNYIIIIATIGNIVSIAFFNFSGISVTKQMSATTRMVLDSCRTLIIWVISLAVKWQPFIWQAFLVQATGFGFLVVGMFVYNDLVCGPYLRRKGIIQPHTDALSEETPGINPANSGDEREPLIKPRHSEDLIYS